MTNKKMIIKIINLTSTTIYKFFLPFVCNKNKQQKNYFQTAILIYNKIEKRKQK